MSHGQFKDFIHRAKPLPGRLGLTHVTDCARLPGLIAGRELSPRDCQVYGEPLVYLFYGRPSYRRNWDRGATSNLDYARICLIVRDDVANSAHRIMPFDSGGFERYRGAIHESLSLSDFEVLPTDHPLKVIGAFYDTLEAYWTMEPIQPRSFPITQNVVRSYYQLITGGLTEQFDDRCAAVEVQLSTALPLDGRVLGLIGPNQIFDDPAVMNVLSDWGAEPRGYRIPRVFNPKEVAGCLLGEVARFFEDRSWL